jgi:hypothetical protein
MSGCCCGGGGGEEDGLSECRRRIIGKGEAKPRRSIHHEHCYSCAPDVCTMPVTPPGKSMTQHYHPIELRL